MSRVTSGTTPMISSRQQQKYCAAFMMQRLTLHLLRSNRPKIMCHNDWGPPNAVFRNKLPYAIIDFDTIAPGLRLWDLGYSVWSWLDLGNPEYTADEQLRRLAVFADAYALPSCSVRQIVAYVLARQTTLAAWAKARGEGRSLGRVLEADRTKK